MLCDERRPDVVPALPPDGPVPCPHCPDHGVGRTLAAWPADGPWSARAVPHRLPAVRVEATDQTSASGPYLEADGLGAHEVLVESPVHAPLREQPLERSVAASWLLRSRLRDLRQDRRLTTFAWWREEGSSTCHHPVSQLVALPYVPETVARRVSNQVQWAARHGRPLLREIAAAELDDGRRVVRAFDGALVACPWAPRASFEVWVVPRWHHDHPADAPEEVWAEVAAGVHLAARALVRVLGPVPLSTTLSCGPVDAPPGVGWTVHLRPRTTPPDGFAETSGTTMVGIFPEESAALLRSVLAEPTALVR